MATKPKKDYTSSDIQHLNDRDHVRLRSSLYLGHTKPSQYTIPMFTDSGFAITQVEFIPAVYKAVGEIIDNCVDELTQLTKKNKILELNFDSSTNTFQISDNGRGVPIDMHETGVRTPQVVFCSLRSGRNFIENKQAGVIGMNGMGAALTNFCSTHFTVAINRDGKKYTQKYSDGCNIISKPSVVKGSATKTGTSISFSLDPTVFENINLPEKLLRSRAMEIAFNNPGITVKYNGTQFKYTSGLEELVKQTCSGNYFKFENDWCNIYTMTHGDIDTENLYTWVNSSFLYDGGLCNTQISNAFFDKLSEHVQQKAKCVPNKNDLKQKVLMLATIKVSNPEYDSQSKTRFIGPNLRKEFKTLIDDMWVQFVSKNKNLIAELVELAKANDKSSTTKQLQDDLKKGAKLKIPGLMDATSKDRMLCSLIVTEGDSASSMIDAVRDPAFIASLPLSGKINNVYGCTPAKLKTMPKVINLIQAIGLVPGKVAVRDQLNFGRVIIATDADTDGGDIFTLLVNIFYQFWPELFEPTADPFIQRLIAPNVVASKKDKRIHFVSMDAFKKNQSKYTTGWDIDYFKGLGSMTFEDWSTLLNNPKQYLLGIVDDDDTLKNTLELLFGPDPMPRKCWLSPTYDVNE